MFNKNSFPSLMTLVGFSVAALFVVFGLYVIFAKQLQSIPKEFRNIFGIIVVGYGLFRTVIIYQKHKQGKESDDEME
jgi:prepilin signal peptidase PulO-like enzyme (type II secretory pathway)